MNKSLDLSPVIADSEEGEDTGGDTHVGDKVVEAAVEGSEEPGPGIERRGRQRGRQSVPYWSLMNMKEGIQLRVEMRRSERVRESRK